MGLINYLFPNQFKLNHAILEKDLDSDYDAYLKLKEWFKGRQIEKKKLVFYSPGSGSDMLTLLAMYDAIVSKKNSYVEFHLLDFRDFFDGAIGQLEALAPLSRIIISEDKNSRICKAVYKDKTVVIVFYSKEFSTFFPERLKHGIDIYYERAFEMFRSRENYAMERIYKKMAFGGLMITDHSFDFGRFKNNFKRLKGIPTQFGLYQKFQIWQRTFDRK